MKTPRLQTHVVPRLASNPASKSISLSCFEVDAHREGQDNVWSVNLYVCVDERCEATNLLGNDKTGAYGRASMKRIGGKGADRNSTRSRTRRTYSHCGQDGHDEANIPTDRRPASAIRRQCTHTTARERRAKQRTFLKAFPRNPGADCSSCR